MYIKILIVALCFSTLILADQAPKPHRNEILDANHFFSQDNKQKQYKINGLQKDKTVAIVIKPTDKSAYQNEITLTISSGSKRKQCKYRSFEDLCILESVPQSQGTLDIKCAKLPCDVEWKIYQPPVNKLQNADKVANLYQIPKDSNRLLLGIFCKSVVQKQKSQGRIAMSFSNIPFQTVIVSQSSMYVVFDQVKQGYIYFLINPKYKQCANIRVTKGPKSIGADYINDFIKGNKKIAYDIVDVPNNKDFRFDISLHHPFGAGLEKGITISVTGVNGGQKKTIRQNNIVFNPTYTSFDFSYVVPKINTNDWKQIRLELLSQTSMLLLEILMQKSQRLQVQATEFSYFDLKKGQKLQYKLISQKNAEDKDQIKITPSDSNKIQISRKQQCKLKQGCDFEVSVKEDTRGYIYLGTGTGQVKQIVLLDFGNENSFTHKIKQLMRIYIKKKFQVKKAIQVTVNSPNVIIYMATTKKCKVPSESCYDRIANINRHFVYYPDTQELADVIFLIKALDTCQFTLTIIPEGNQYVTLVDSQPFVYMFDKQEKQLKFRFRRDEKVDVNFNLIAPLHALDLIADNGKKLPEDQDALISAQGYLQFKAENSPKSDFTILVRKRDGFENKYVHFTLIASTKGKQIRLQSGITHYQTLTKQTKNNAQYIFQFDPDQQYLLNFYLHNTKQQDIKIKLLLKALGQNKDNAEQKTTKLIIDKTSDVLNLKDVSKQLCSAVDDDSYCQISMELQNAMDIQIDIAITLMTRHTILQLKDGLWQSYSLNSIAKTAHFYFFPRNKNQDIGIMYKTTNPAIRLKYRLFYAKDDQIDPSQWPFPSEQIQQKDLQEQRKYKPINHFSISQGTLKQCWPNCLILISIIDLQQKTKDLTGGFSLMASNSIMEIPQKQKIDITLKQGQSKAYLVDLKYAIDIQQNIYFYIYHSIGLTSIFANVYSEKNDRIPDQEMFDFNLNSQNQIIVPISAIKEIITREEMDDHLNLYLFIVIEALSDAKLAIQFTFNQIDEPNQKLISIDSLQHLALTQNSNKIFYTPIDIPYEVKISRQTGFPFYSSMVCKKDIDKCLQQMRNNKEKGQQILTKVAAYTAKSCDGCFYLFKITTEEDPCQLNIHLQSIISQIELTENKPIYDFTEGSQANKYVLYAIRGEQIYVNIHISQGQIQAEFTDLHSIRLNKTGAKIISFIVPGEATQVKKFDDKKMTVQQKQQLEKDLQKNQKSLQSIQLLKKQNPALTQALMSAFGLSDKFIQIHVSIRSTSATKPSIYTITYSSGDRQFQLQDGLITDYLLQPDNQAVFYYSSRAPGHVYFTIQMQKSSYLKDLDISMKYCVPQNNIIDDDCWVEYNTQKPPIKDKTPNPTIMYSLIDKNHLSIGLKYKGEHSQKVSLGINHQQIMILPYQVEFPFILHKGQKISFIVQLSNAGYIQIITRKCDESNPTFSYTFDYDSFQKDQFTYQAELGVNPKSRFMTKVKPGTLYMKMKTPDEEQSMVSILVRYSEQKIRDTELLPGNKGNVQYSIIDSANGQLTIKPPACAEAECGKFKYYLMTTNKMRDLYAQLVCPSNFFSNLQFYSADPVPMTEITPVKNADGTVTIPFKLLDQISYVGVKVANSKGKQVFYKPIEVATLWGQLSRTSHSHKLAIASIFICGILGLIICVRRNARKGYTVLKDQRDQI